ncbi:hypothetical protein Y032_0069g309 [Ancylostoma ceylanicum]|nr:hypothetical protein Y032_0069g309 [Ancylostoma ceylanicum]
MIHIPTILAAVKTLPGGVEQCHSEVPGIVGSEMGNSQSYDVTNVSGRGERQEKVGKVKQLKDDLPPLVIEADEKEKTENKSPNKHEGRHDEHQVEHHKSAAPAPPPEPVDMAETHEKQQTHEIGNGVSASEVECLHRVEEPETIPVDAFPAQSRYD